MLRNIEFGSFKPSGELAEDLMSVFGELAQTGSILSWSVLFFDGVGDITSTGRTMRQFQDEVSSNECGVLFSWSDLLSFSDCIFQPYEVLIAGFPSNIDVSQMRRRGEILAVSSIVVELVDCSIWKVSAECPAVIDRLRLKFGSRASRT